MKKTLFGLLFALLSVTAFSQAGRMFPTFGGATGNGRPAFFAAPPRNFT